MNLLMRLKARYEIHCWIKNRKRHPSLLGYILMLLLAVLCVYIIVDVINKNNNSVNHIIEILTLLVMAYTARQVIIMRENSAMEMSQAVYKDLQEAMNEKKLADHDTDIDQLKSNILKLTTKEEITKNKDYLDVNELVYHYEYLGQLVRYNKVDFGLIFDTVTFPDTLWEKLSEGGEKSVLAGLRCHWYDKWDGFEYLHVSYELLRKYDELARFDNSKYLETIKAATEEEKKKKAEEKKEELSKNYETAILEWVKVKNRLKGKRIVL